MYAALGLTINCSLDQVISNRNPPTLGSLG
jgi:hypothetical protein